MEKRRRTALWAAGAAAGAAVAAYAANEWLRDKRFKEPGPALPLLGHLYRLDIKNLPCELERLRSTVRDTTMGMWLGSGEYLVYVTTTPELTHKVFAEHGGKSSGRSAEMPAEIDIGNHGLVLNEGEPWEKNCKLILRELVGSRDRCASRARSLTTSCGRWRCRAPRSCGSADKVLPVVLVGPWFLAAPRRRAVGC